MALWCLVEEDDFISFPGCFPAEEARAPFCLPVSAPASCAVLGKGEALLLSPSAVLGIAGCVQGWVPGQQRRAQHLHPNQIPSALTPIPPGSPGAQEQSPRALRESFPCSFALGVEQPLKNSPPGQGRSILILHLPTECPAGYPSTNPCPQHSLAEVTLLSCPVLFPSLTHCWIPLFSPHLSHSSS